VAARAVKNWSCASDSSGALMAPIETTSTRSVPRALEEA